jgi:Mg2+-importing ATPase
MIVPFAGIAALTIIPFSSLGPAIGLMPLPPVYFAWLALTIFLYMALVTVFKKIFVGRYGELL